MRIIQKIIILLNFKPFTYLFQAVYSFGLNRLVDVLTQLPAVHCVFGCGSFFEGRCLYGLSDIDLIIVIDKKYSRIDTEPHRITEAYNKVRRFFPFLGNWHEKAENLIFLSELHAGFPVPESFRFRWKQGRLFQLYGKTFPEEMVKGTVSTNEVVAEIATLLRMAITKGEVHTSNLLFWKRIFTKLLALADIAGFKDLSQEIKSHRKLVFIDTHEVLLYICKSAPEELFPVLLESARQMFKRIQETEKSVTLTPTILGSNHLFGATDNKFPDTFKATRAIREIRKMSDSDLKTLRSSLFGIAPRLNYFPMDKPVPMIEMKDGGYKDVRMAVKMLARHGNESEAILFRVKDLILIMCKLETFVDVVPLDPIIFANVHVQLSNESKGFEMPLTVYEEQKAESEDMFRALAGLYKKNEGWVAKMPFPCIYLEDDLVVIMDAFHRMRVFLLHTDTIDIVSLDELVDVLGRKHPGCREFLVDLLDYYRHLIDPREQKRYANNLYRCLHQFMSQLLSGESDISVDAHRKQMGITVGIITRNRATDLNETLGSLTRQMRPADEVLIVDNGSTDQTRRVVGKFQDLLPISYCYLEEASIPLARNMVIENAKHEIISFTDDDCIVEPGWLDAVERGFLRADNVGIVGGWVKHEPAPEASMIDTYYSLFHHNTT